MVVYALNDGPLYIHLPAETTEDKATNPNAESNTIYFVFDGIPPATNLSSTTTAFYTRYAIDVRVDFKETMFNFEKEDIVVKDVTGVITVDNFLKFNDGASYNGTVNPAEGKVVVYVPAASAVDANDNINTYSNTLGFIFDTTGAVPLLVCSTSDLAFDDVLYTQDRLIPVALTWNEYVISFSEVGARLSPRPRKLRWLYVLSPGC